MSLPSSTVLSIKKTIELYPDVVFNGVVVLNKEYELIGSHNLLTDLTMDVEVIQDLIREIRKWGLDLIEFDYTTSQHSHHVIMNRIENYVMLYVS